MASNRRLKKKKKTSKNKQSKRVKGKDKTFRDLPFDLVRLIFSFLPLKDNIRASTVCKTWHEVCVSVRVVATTPWLMYFSKVGEFYELYDPLMQKTHILQYSELSGYRVCYSKDGWLLMYNATSFELFLFNPFTRDRKPVPSQWMAYDQRMAFSCAPTSTSCLLFTISRVTSNHITIKTCSHDAKMWITSVFKNELPQNSNSIEQIVFSNGVFYCLTNTGCVLLFHPSLNYMSVLPERAPKRSGRNGSFMTEHQGEIFLIYMHKNMNPKVLKLNLTTCEWTVRKTLGGLTIYASALSSESRAEQQGIRNCLCLSVIHGFKRSCICYEVCRDNKISLKWKKRNPYENIWIMPPINLRDLPLFDKPLM